jgi:hypothetical protein
MAVEYGDEFHPVPPNAIGDDVGGIGDDQFAGSRNSLRLAHGGLGLKKFNRIKNALGYEGGNLSGVPGDVVSERYQVLDRPILVNGDIRGVE